jgi:hypothetical protein
MTDTPSATIPGDRRPMRLWSWLAAIKSDMLAEDPAEFASKLTPDLMPRIIELGPEVAIWLHAVAKVAERPNRQQKSA